MFTGRAAGIDVDRNQRFGVVDHDAAAGSQLHGRREHRIQLAFDPHPREQRLAVAILFDRAHVRGHQHLHEIAGFLIAGFAGDLDFVDFLVVEVAQRSLDQRAFLVDQRRRLRLKRHVPHGFPHADQILEVALDFGLGARCARGAQNNAHSLGHVEVLHHFLQPRAILCRGDLAADAAAARGVGHQYRIATGQRQVSRQRGALVAAFFLDHLHQHHLAALDDFLDLVLPARTAGALAHLLHDVAAANGFNDFLRGLSALVVIIMVPVAMRGGSLFGVIRRGGLATGMLTAAVFGLRRVVGMGGVFARVLLVGMLIMGVLFGRRRIWSSGGGFDGCGIGQGHRRQRLACENIALLVMSMIVLIVRVFMTMFMMVVIMMLCIRVVMFGLVRVLVTVFGMQVSAYSWPSGGWAACAGSVLAFSMTSLWMRSPPPRRRELRWRGRRRLERVSLSSSASRWARSSASISAWRSATGI